MYEQFKHYYEITGGHEDDIVLHKLYLQAGHYIGQGEESCIIGHGLGVLSVSLYPQDISKVQELQTISGVLESVDPMESMFIRPKNIRLESYGQLSADVVKEYAICLTKTELPPLSADSQLLVTESSRATPVNNQFILERISIIKRNLEKLHASNWVHGDIHEGNIMQKGGDVVIIDWGKARPLTQESLRIEMKLLEEMRQRLINDQGKRKPKRSPARSPGSVRGFFSPDESGRRGFGSEEGAGAGGRGLFGSDEGAGSGGLFGSPKAPLAFSPARGVAHVAHSPARIARPPSGSTGPYRVRPGLASASKQSPGRAAPTKDEGGV